MRRIDADELLDRFANVYFCLGGDRPTADMSLVYHSLCNAVKRAPTVEQPTGEWIPVSERLPDKDGKYLLWGCVTEDDEGYYSFVGGFDSGCEKFGDWEELYDSVTLACVDSEFFEYYEVIAWMPLPEPYK